MGGTLCRSSTPAQVNDHPHAGLADTVVSDLRRRCVGLHQHRERPSPPKLQPRVAAGATIRAVEAQWSAGDCSGGEGKV